jgi:hypothetical protein
MIAGLVVSREADGLNKSSLIKLRTRMNACGGMGVRNEALRLEVVSQCELYLPGRVQLAGYFSESSGNSIIPVGVGFREYDTVEGVEELSPELN